MPIAAGQKADRAGQATLGGQRFGFLEVERVHVNRGDQVGAAKTLRQQPVESRGLPATEPQGDRRLAEVGQNDLGGLDRPLSIFPSKTAGEEPAPPGWPPSSAVALVSSRCLFSGPADATQLNQAAGGRTGRSRARVSLGSSTQRPMPTAMPWRWASVLSPGEGAMVESGGIRPIDCACGKPFIWVSERGIELQCDGCRRRVLLPFKDLVGVEQLVRFVDRWRSASRK